MPASAATRALKRCRSASESEPPVTRRPSRPAISAARCSVVMRAGSDGPVRERRGGAARGAGSAVSAVADQANPQALIDRPATRAPRRPRSD
jgi:hypothetical protein